MNVIVSRCIAFMLLCTSLLACSSEMGLPDPRTLPYRFEEIREFGAQVMAVDLDGDGRSELLDLAPTVNLPKGFNALMLRTHEGGLIDQINFQGDVLRAHFLDVSENDRLEILVPVVRNDSLFLTVVDAEGKKHETIFLTDGKPREDDDGSVFPWDPTVAGMQLVDVNADGHQELVTVLNTRYARLPRGVLIHTWPGGKLLSKKIVGAMTKAKYWEDVDDDGHIEIISEGQAPNNGAVAGGYDDKHAYMLVFELRTAPRIEEAKKLEGPFTYLSLFYDNFDDPEKKSILAASFTQSPAPDKVRFELIEPDTWEAYRSRELNEPLLTPGIADLNRDGHPEIITVRSPDEVWIFDETLNMVRKHRYGIPLSGIGVLPDIDEDGLDNVYLSPKNGNGYLFLDASLKIKAVLEEGQNLRPVLFRRGVGNTPYLVSWQDGRTVALRLVENRLYLLYRYGPWVLWGGFAGVWIVLGLLIVRLNQKRREALALTAQKERELEEARRLIAQLQEKQQRWEHSKEPSDAWLAQELATETPEDSLARVYAILSERYNNSTFGVEELASALGWSTRKLQRYLREKIDKTPSEIIWTFRLDRAKALMDERGSTARVAEIAYAVGFENSDHFSTRFKEAFGLTPSQYLKKGPPQNTP